MSDKIHFTNRTVGEVLDDIQFISQSTTAKGRNFEELFLRLASRIASLQVKNIWAWADWPQRSAHNLRARDTGIDLVVELNNGDTVAVQCKLYAEGHNISKADIASFIAGAKPKIFNRRWLVSVNKCGEIAEELCCDHDIETIDLRDYLGETFGDSADGKHGYRPLQEPAVEDVVAGFKQYDSGRLIMACGTGKTFTSLRIAEQIAPCNENSARVLFIAPSLSLIAQAHQEWAKYSARRLFTVVICSDQDADEATEDMKNMLIDHKVTTDPDAIAAALNAPIARENESARVAFCTYQSLDKLCQAQNHCNPPAPAFDIAIVDEAHRTTGLIEEDKKVTGKRAKENRERHLNLFKRIYEPGKYGPVQVAKRLYMTATPRIYDKKDGKSRVVDMGDNEVYGPEFHHIKFKDAINAGILCNYRVIALGIDENLMGEKLQDRLLQLNEETPGKGNPADKQTRLALGAIGLALNGIVKSAPAPGVLARTIAYANNIRKSEWLVKAFGDPQFKRWITNAAAHNVEPAPPAGTWRDFFIALWRNCIWLAKRIAGRPAGEHLQLICIFCQLLPCICRWFGWRLPAPVKFRALPIHAEHLDGRKSIPQRQEALRKLREEASLEKPHLISNAQLFTEGVDVPALNAIAFLEPRKSKIDTIQAVGRVMRTDAASEKECGYIIVPVILPPGADLLQTLESEASRFKSLANVLRALQSHDESFKTEWRSRVIFEQYKKRDDGEKREFPEPERIPLDEQAQQQLFAKVADHSGVGRAHEQFVSAVEGAVDEATEIFISENATPVIAEVLGTPADNEQETCKTAALLIINACIMHKRLDDTGDLNGFQKLTFAAEGDIAKNLRAAWKVILRHDYLPIFQAPLALIKKLPRNQNIKSALNRLLRTAAAQASTLNELGFDHSGPLYHKVLGSARADGAFYTKPVSAYLLAKLAFDETFCDWSDAAAVRKLKIIDPACGTGTLLMAALKVIKEQAKKHQGLDEIQTAALHKVLVEHSMHGFDINHHAVQLAACNLTIGAPGAAYQQMHLRRLNYGAQPGGEVNHGALEFLLGGGVQTTIIKHEVGGEDVETKTVTVDLPEVNAVIFNPPFTDISKSAANMSPAAKKAMDARLAEIKKYLVVNDPAAATAIGRMSVGPFFTPMTNKLLSPARGTMAKVIPATACTSANGVDERKYIAANFHIDYVITSHDPTTAPGGVKNCAFSANTGIHECLLIGRRRQFGDKTATNRINPSTGLKPGATVLEDDATVLKDDSTVAEHARHFSSPNQPPSSTTESSSNAMQSSASTIQPFSSAAQTPSSPVAPAAPTRFIQLTKFPADTAAVDKLIAAVRAGDPGDYTETAWRPEAVAAGDWTPVQWCNPDLAYAAADMDNLPNCKAAADVCPAAYLPQAFRGDFNYDAKAIVTSGGNAFCSVSEKLLRCIATAPTHNATLKPTKQKHAEQIKAKESHLLIPERFGTTANQLLAIYSEPPAFGSACFAMGVGDEDTAKAYAAFMNSSFGILQMLNRRTSKMTYPSFEVGHLETLRLPDPAAANLQPLLDAFEKVKDKPLQRLAECDTDPFRKMLDYAAADAIARDANHAKELRAQTDRWRDLLAREPTITGKPYTQPEGE